MMKNNWEGFITFLGTEDLEATDKFYREVLGLDLYKDQGVCRIYEIAPGGKIGFCSHIKAVLEERSPIITLLTNDVDGVYHMLRQGGYELNEEPKINPKFNIYHFFVKDPNGYTVEVQRFLD
jgi:catechol 2,3-dioxygenase-like lactoylglutathione lyase family enzyme